AAGSRPGRPAAGGGPSPGHRHCLLDDPARGSPAGISADPAGGGGGTAGGDDDVSGLVGAAGGGCGRRGDRGRRRAGGEGGGGGTTPAGGTMRGRYRSLAYT